MIEFPLILIGYAVVPFIAIQVMIMADRPHEPNAQSTFPQAETLRLPSVLLAVEPPRA